jgi:exonuclease III
MMDTTTNTNLTNVRNLSNYYYSHIPFSNNPQNIPYLTFAIHNIQKSYNADIIITMMNKNIHILHLCETNLIRSKTENTYENTFETQTYEINDLINPLITHKGVTAASIFRIWVIDYKPFIISSFCQKHLSTIISIPGRYIKLSLTFKKKNNYQIIGLYIPHKNSKNYNTFALSDFQQNLHKHIAPLLHQNNKTLIMRDFNLNPDSTKLSQKEKNSILKIVINIFSKHHHILFKIIPQHLV